MSILNVNQTKCTQCGLCSVSCPIGIIIQNNDFPQLRSGTDKACIACGHCVAICPTEALDNSKNPLKNQALLKKFPVIDPETGSQFMRSRRSIRNYKTDKVSKDLLLKLLDIAHFAPTGGNTQNISYKVIQNEEILKKIPNLVVEWMENEIEKQIPWIIPYSSFPAIFRKTGYDIILRNAPVLIIALAPSNLTMGRDNTCFSLSYAELYATTLGLGSCWAGFFDMCLQAKYEPLLQLLDIPETKKGTGAIMVGYPKYSYSRLPDRNPLDVLWD